jgi:hypothetical protein
MTYPSAAVRRPYARSASLNALNAAHQVEVGDTASLVFGVFSAVAPTGIQLIAEGRLSDTSPWLGLNMRPTNDVTSTAPITQTAAINAQPTNGWRVSTAGFSTVRVRVAAITSGSVVVETRLSDKIYS